jgi:hypothetical protein
MRDNESDAISLAAAGQGGTQNLKINLMQSDASEKCIDPQDI